MTVTIFSEVSIDGKLTFGKDTSSKYMLELLSDEGHRHIHEFRSKADAIMVGRKTITIDNPMLSVRYGKRNNDLLRIIPSQSLNFSLMEQIFTDDLPTMIVSSEKNKMNPMVGKIESMGKECVFFGKEEIDFLELFRYLEKVKNIKCLIVEGGGMLNKTLLDNELIDKIVVLQLPIIVGNKEATCFVEDINSKNDIINNFSISTAYQYNDFIEIIYTKNK